MPLEGEYEPPAWDWVREQIEEYEASGGERANTLMDTGLPIIVITMRGAKSGKIRKTALMRVEHEGEYALVASVGGAPEHPTWYGNLVADPTALMIQDGPEPYDYVARELEGEERQCGGTAPSRPTRPTRSTRRGRIARSRSSWRGGRTPPDRSLVRALTPSAPLAGRNLNAALLTSPMLRPEIESEAW